MASRVLCVLFIKLVSADDLINIEIAPESVIKGIQALATSQYLRGLADEFVMKAASHLMDQYEKNSEIPNDGAVPTIQVEKENKNVQNQLFKFETPSLLGPQFNNPTIDMDGGDGTQIFQKEENVNQNSVPRNSELPSAQVLAFLQDPADDGDNQEREFDLSDYEFSKSKIPLKTEYKINGRHFRRVPDLIFVY